MGVYTYLVPVLQGWMGVAVGGVLVPDRMGVAVGVNVLRVVYG